MSPMSATDVQERKSRRTHKNSRDGCPNCKAKRIKCTEELPQCSNCIKKKSRCGYLDFPREKLDLIRIKNENRLKEEMFMKEHSSNDRSKLKKSASSMDKKHSTMTNNSSSNSNNGTILSQYSTSTNQNYQLESVQLPQVSTLDSQTSSTQSQTTPYTKPRQSLNSLSSGGGSISSNTKGFSGSSISSNQSDFIGFNGLNGNFQDFQNKPHDMSYQPVTNGYHIPYYSNVPENSMKMHSHDLNNDHHLHQGIPIQNNELQDDSSAQVMKFQHSPLITSSASQTPQQIDLIQPPLFSNMKVSNDITFNQNSLQAAPAPTQQAPAQTSTTTNNTYSNPLAVGLPLHQQSSIHQDSQHEVQTQTTMLPHNNYTSFEIPNYPILDFYDYPADFASFSEHQFTQSYMFHEIPNQVHGLSTVSESAHEPDDSQQDSTNVSDLTNRRNSSIAAKRMFSIPEATTPKAKRSRCSLPNSIVKPTKFKKSTFMETRFLDTELVYYFLPVWNHELSFRFWERTIYSSFRNPVLFSFLLDKCLGLLLSDVNIVLKSEYLKNFHNTYQPVTSIEQSSAKTGASRDLSKPLSQFKGEMDEDFFFNRRILSAFVKLSFKYYGNLITNIKLYLNKYHIEETIRISFLSSYSSYFLLNSSMKTLIKLNYGTSSLLQKFMNDCTDYSQLTPVTKYVLDILHNHVNFCLVPELKLELVSKLTQQFKKFKNFLATGTNLYQSLKSSQTIRDFFPKHDCIQLETFLNLLMDKLHPNILNVNEQYGATNDEVRFVPVTDVFEIINQYFKMIPNITNVLGSRVFIFQRVFYLFFVALGKLLNHVFTPIKSLFNVDLTNVSLLKIDFNFKSFEIDQEKEGLTDEQFEYLDKITKNLLRFISYLNFRNLLYGHYLSNSTVLDGPVVKLVNQKQGVVEIIPPKLDFKEKDLEITDDFEFPIELEHFPQFPEFKHYPQECFTRNRGVEPGSLSYNEFDFDIGLLSSDFNPSKLISQFLENQKTKWEFNTIRLSELKVRSNRFNEIKAILNESINDSS